MFERFRQLRMSQKFALMVLVMGIPFVIVVNLLIGQGQGQVATARNEIDGVDYLLAWRQPFQAVGQHRAATAAVLTGDGNFRATQLSLQAKVDAGFSALDVVDAKFGERFGTTPILNESKRLWQDLKSRVQSISQQESANRHSELVAKLADLRRRATDKSQLILDPDLDTYYLMDAVALQLPEYAERLSLIRTLALPRPGPGSPTSRCGCKCSTLPPA